MRLNSATTSTHANCQLLLILESALFSCIYIVCKFGGWSWWYDDMTKGNCWAEREWPSSCEEQWSAESISDSCSSSASGFLQILSKKSPFEKINFFLPNLKQSSVIPGLKLLSFEDSVFSKALVIVHRIILQCTCSTCWESSKWQGDWITFEQSVSQCLWGQRHDRLSRIFLQSNFNIYLCKNKKKQNNSSQDVDLLNFKINIAKEISRRKLDFYERNNGELGDCGDVLRWW